MKTTVKTSCLLFVSFIIASLFFASCKSENRARQMPESVNAYVYAYTSGTISKASPIRVRFASAVGQDGGEAPTDIISFSPSVSGDAMWEDAQTLRFEPTEYFKPQTAYVATVNLKKLFPQAPDDAKTFEFDFRTRDQFFDVEVYGLQAPEPSDLQKQNIVGAILTSDIIEQEPVEKLLTAKQNGKSLSIEWTHLTEQLRHEFTVTGVQRSEQASEVELSWNGKPLNVSIKDTRKMEIPSLSDFKVMDARPILDEDQYIVLNFSDPLQENQNFNGLVTITDYDGELRFIANRNELRIYPTTRIVGERMVSVEPGLRNSMNKSMANRSLWKVSFADIKPQVRLVGSGVILPNSNGLVFPFEAVNLNAVEVEIFKIYHNNILQFLQTNDLDGLYSMEQVGRVIMQKRVDLKQLNPNARSSEWTRYALDLGQLISGDPEAIYQVRIGFRPGYSNYFCGSGNVTASSDANDLTVNATPFDENGDINSIWDDWYGVNGYYEGYRWEQREDPCYSAYYNSDNFVRRNVLSSNLGIIAKGGKDNSMFVAISDLRTTKSVSGAELTFYDYQQQVIASAKTDGDGTAKVQLNRPPFVVLAKQGDQKGYLKLLDPNALSLSRFDVSGEVVQKGLKGFIYGERGVWRPGDSLYLNFILEDESGKLPPNYPITFELYDSRGQLQERRTTSESVENIYSLHTATSPDVPTGNWIAKVKAGGATFEKVLKIETVKPNRLKVELEFGKKMLSVEDEPISASLNVSWLHGAPARNLKAQVDMEVQATNTTFEKYKDYEFDDPAREIYSEPVTVFDGTLNEQGQAAFTTNILGNNKLVPGKLIANFRTRAFENSGDFSTDAVSIPYFPYRSFAGISIPQDDSGEKRLDIGKPKNLDFVVVDENGNPLSGKNLTVGLYKIEWRWWWDQGQDYVARYNSSSHFDAQQATDVTTNQRGQATWSVQVDDWGRYMVRVCDTESGHCSGDFFYAGYPWYENGDNTQARQAAAMIAFASDKEKYTVGETVKITVPAGNNGRALVSIENGTGVIQSFWKDTKAGENTFEFKATADMAPTVYANVSLIQPHAQVENDLPIRMYGVIPISVEDPKTILQPTLKMPDELKPEQTITVEVAEKNKQAMAYTIALVDEGLLGLTRFRTPNPHEAFYAREALGVKTWDVYDYVLGAYGGELERILSIGGDGGIVRPNADDAANRFKPVVQHLGPFLLKKGQTAKHQITIPNYVGAVRTMVVAANAEGAYGSVEKSTPVKKPLMVLATLPRVLSPTEQVKLPVTVFAMDKKVKNVTVSVEESTGLVRFTGGKQKTINFSNVGDQIVPFDIEVSEKVGIAKFKVTAQGGGETSTQEIEIDVRNPNPYVTNVVEAVLEANQSHTFTYEAVGMVGTNTGVLEVSNIPPIDLEKRLNYLLQYPYGCIEQTISTGFPQLFVTKLIELNDRQKKQIPENIRATINAVKQFQTGDGGFAYWPGQSEVSNWGTNYAGHFLLEAQNLGYAVPASVLDRWKSYQRNKAKTWRMNQAPNGQQQYDLDDLTQAYRLYTLALAKSADLSAMNRMRELPGLSIQARWRLAAAYAVAGKPEVATQLVNKVSTDIPAYQQLGYTYGSNIRDQAMILETLVLMKNRQAGADVVRTISSALSSGQWQSTQTIGYSLMAISKFVGEGEVSNKFNFAFKLGNEAQVNAGSNTPIMHIEVPVDGNANKTVLVKNTGSGILFARLILNGQPVIGDQTAVASNLQMTVNYTDLSGKPINISQLQQGTDFIAEVTLSNPGTRGITYQEMALNQIFPSGWEILNSRMDNLQGVVSTVPEYQDIRDDRVYTFFDLGLGSKHTYRIQLNAAYQGRYYLPTQSCGAMYDNSIQARVPGQWVEVVQAGEI